MRVLYPRPALVVIACPCHHRLPLSSSPALVIATHRHRRHPPSLLLPARTHRRCQRIASALVEACTCCCSWRALVIAAYSRCQPHLLPSLPLPLIGCLD